MRFSILLLILIAVLGFSGCVPVEKMARHDFGSGIYKFQKNGLQTTKVYTKVLDDSIVVYPMSSDGNNEAPDISLKSGAKISSVNSDSYFYRSTFISNSVDIDLTTVVMKYRPAKGGVPNQLSYNVNAAIYVGLRKDFYKLVPYKTPLNEETSYIRQIGFDVGLFTGIGMTPINPTVTQNQTIQEYDGIVFQNGVAGFITIDNISVGIAVGFDNLLDRNRTIWVYNQRPYLGLVIGISNF